MHYISNLFKLLGAFFSASFGILDIAEILNYDWDGIFPLANWHGWTELYGNPFEVLVDGTDAGSGIHIIEGGWLDMRYHDRIAVTCEVTGGNASAVGTVDFIFQAAFSMINPDQQWLQDDMRIDVLANADNTVRKTETLDVTSMSYMRLYSIRNRGVEPVIVRAITSDGVKPVRYDPSLLGN